MKKINYLEEGKAKATVYFTQGNNELALNAANPAGANPGLSNLKERLEKAGYEVKELKFGPESDKVPADAAVVVVARPTTELSPTAQKALHDYMLGPDAKGKMVVLTDALAGRDGRVVKTGLEGLLREFNVQAEDNRVLSLRTRRPGWVLVEPEPNSRNPIARAFNQSAGGGQFLFEDAREVKPRAAEGNAPANNRFTAETLLIAPPEYYVWGESNLQADPGALIDSLRKAGAEAVMAKISRSRPARRTTRTPSCAAGTRSRGWWSSATPPGSATARWPATRSATTSSCSPTPWPGCASGRPAATSPTPRSVPSLAWQTCGPRRSPGCT